MKYVTLVPAYSRDYKTQAEVKKAWAEGKDFQIQDMSHPNNGAYVNKDDPGIQGTTFNIRFKNMTGVCPIKVK